MAENNRLYRIFGFVITIASIGFLPRCQEHQTTIELNTEYEPKLVIQAAASPQHGAAAVIRYSQPLKGMDAVVPELPHMEVYLLENKKRIQQFGEDSTGWFSISGETLHLKANTPYSLEVVDTGTGETWLSGESFLPEEPNFNHISAKADSVDKSVFELALRLGRVRTLVPALSIWPVNLDGNGIPSESYSLKNQFNPQRIGFPDEQTWTEKIFSEKHSRVLHATTDSLQLADRIEVRVAYFSDELARFIRDADEINYFGEEIFQSVRPVYSNIKDGVGVFGLYQENLMQVQIKVKH